MTASVRPGALRRLLLPLLIALSLSVLAPRDATAQPSERCADDQRVHAIRFDGSPLYDDATLAASIATRAPTLYTRVKRRFGLGALPCSDSVSLELDGLRLAVLHRQAGWVQSSVTVLQQRADDGVRVLFQIVPGPAVILDSVHVSGLPEWSGGGRPLDAPLRAREGQRFDRVRFDEAVTSVVTRLRDAGYARATRPTVALRIDTGTSRVDVDLTFTPGRLVTVRAVTVDVQGIGDTPPTVDSATIRSLSALRAGERFRASDVLNAQRNLYRSDVFRLVLIDTVAPPGAAPSDSLIDLQISVAEARTRNARAGVGWATLECMRAQARLVDRRFLGVGRRLELTARASRIGIGPPADFAPSLCSRALRADTQFTVLNHYLGVTVSNTRLFGTPFSPVATVYTERRSEPYAYVREIGVGALIELSRQFSTRTSSTTGIQYENGRTKIDPAESCSRFGQCRAEEYQQAVFGRGIGIVSASLTHDRANSAIDPTRGFRVRGEARIGQTFATIDSSVRFYRGSGEASAYTRALGGVIATRVQLARAFAPGAQLVDGSPLIPQQERLFAGGQSSVRGYQQNLLGPLAYVVSSVPDTVINDGVTVIQSRANADNRPVPRGGTALLVANFEYRRSFRWLAEQLQLAAFVDVGNIWEGASEPFRFGNLRATPGMGLRVLTALGPFRVDVGYQPYEPRAGQALYLTPAVNGVGGNIQCASPGNTVSIDPNNPGSIFDCPATFRPEKGSGVLSRLVFHFGLGQAF